MRQRTSRYYKVLSLLLGLWGLSLVTGTMLFGMGGAYPASPDQQGRPAAALESGPAARL